MQHKVLIVGGQNVNIMNMFIANGWKVTVNSLDTDVDLVQFTGGADVDPSYYHEQRHPATHSDPRRDAAEASIYLEFVGKVPMAGICRGGQFLNVMNGGKMWQHVNNHTSPHLAFDELSQKTFPVTSTHHQMMIPAKDGVVLMSADMSDVKQGFDVEVLGHKEEDVEAIFYEETSCLCFQPHPEYMRIGQPGHDVYFKYLKYLFNL